MRPVHAIAASIVATGFAAAQDSPKTTDQPRRPLAVLEQACSVCHGLNRIETEKTRDEWEYTVNNMVGRGARVRPDEVKGLVAYLGKYFGMPVNVNKASVEVIAAELDIPAEDARVIVEARQKEPLKKWADLEKIPGLNLKKVEPVKDRIQFY
jgi:hypothetical protein